ncbi:rhomboid-related protein 4 isoform X2 [Pseudophryne corroboree]|uniref:rhomboid-related protein 4 isoform X2 n=1 Tax=Pseudophryne corroboree TaxID=495146 RepID=UPI003081F325
MFRGRRGGNVGLMLLFFQILNFGLNNIPPVTLAVLGLNIYLFFNPYKPLQYACISVHESYYHDDWQRLLLSPFHHADDWHLYFNMMSLLWKGTKLEQRLGSILFAIIVFVFSQLTGAVYLMVQLFLARYMDDPLYTLQCAVGFSGVLFALKVLNNHYHPGGAYNFFGFLIPNKYSCWAELVAIHFLAPGTSFVGHLSGILVGLLFVHGPLGQILTAAAPLFNSGRAARRGNVRYDVGHSEYRFRDNNTPGDTHVHTRGLSEEEQLQQAIRNSLNERGGRPESRVRDNNTPGDINVHTRGLSEEEQLQQAIRNSLNERGQHASRPLSPEEIRRRRLNRFDR